MARYKDFAELRKNLSPDIVIQDDGLPPTALNKELRKAEKAATETLEDKFYKRWRELGGVELEAQHQFHPERKWRFDFSEPVTMVAFEVQGGIYEAQSGHRSFSGVQRDYEKFNAATIWGWRVIQVTSPMIKDTAYMQSLVDFVDNLR